MFRAILFICFLVAVPAYCLPKSDQRIVGEKEITIDQRPFQVSMLYYGQHRCGGAIINANSILTAAHCCALSSEKAYQIRVGSSSKTSGGVIHDVSQIIIHPNYTSINPEWDVAIMKLVEPIEFNNNAQPIELAFNGYPVNAGETVVVSGWGLTSQDKLYQVELPVFHQDLCVAAYGTKISERMICAGIVQNDCLGDSGGPLTQLDLHVGLVTDGCAFPGYPIVVALTSQFRDFIDANM